MCEMFQAVHGGGGWVEMVGGGKRRMAGPWSTGGWQRAGGGVTGGRGDSRRLVGAAAFYRFKISNVHHSNMSTLFNLMNTSIISSVQLSNFVFKSAF